MLPAVKSVVVLATLISVVSIGSADAARRRNLAPMNRGPETPEIRTSTSNVIPKCVTPERLTTFLTTHNADLDPKFRTIAADYKKHGEALQIRWDFAFYQMLLETNYLKFRRGDGTPGDVKARQNNFAGLGATGNGVPGESFRDVGTGVLAQLQHLVAYSGEKVENPVATRTRDVQDGVIAQSRRLGRPVRFGDLTRRWAADSGYARSIVSVAERFSTSHCANAESEAPVAAAPARINDRPRGLSEHVIDRDSATPRAGLGAAAAAATPKPSASENPNCHVLSASYGGNVTLLIRADGAKGVTLTALDVDGGSEQAQAQSYIATHAPGGKIAGRFKNRTEAIGHAYALCDSGKP